VEDSVGILDSLSNWPPEVLEEASSEYVHLTTTCITNILAPLTTVVCIFTSIVQSVENITQNLVSQEDFNQTLSITMEEIIVQADRV